MKQGNKKDAIAFLPEVVAANERISGSLEEMCDKLEDFANKFGTGVQVLRSKASESYKETKEALQRRYIDRTYALEDERERESWRDAARGLTEAWNRSSGQWEEKILMDTLKSIEMAKYNVLDPLKELQQGMQHIADRLAHLHRMVGYVNADYKSVVHPLTLQASHGRDLSFELLTHKQVERLFEGLDNIMKSAADIFPLGMEE